MGLGTTIAALVLRIGRQLFEFRSTLLLVTTFLQGAHVPFVVLAYTIRIAKHRFVPSV